MTNFYRCRVPPYDPNVRADTGKIDLLPKENSDALLNFVGPHFAKNAEQTKALRQSQGALLERLKDASITE